MTDKTTTMNTSQFTLVDAEVDDDDDEVADGDAAVESDDDDDIGADD